MSLRVYYAHAMGYYGSPREAQVQALLHSLGCEVVCPNAPEHERGFQAFGMGYFDVEFLPRIDVIAYEPYDDGMIGAGVAYELQRCIDAGLTVWRIDRLPGVASSDVQGLLVSHEPPQWRPNTLKVLGREVTRARNLAIKEAA